MSTNYEKNLPDGVEARFVSFSEFRAEDSEDGVVIEGHAATFNEPYDVGPFTEQIAPGAFDDVLEDDVRALVDHDPSQLIGRASSGTLEVSTDDTGLKARIQLPDTTTGQNVAKLIERGDLSEMSFGFEVAEDSWRETEDGQELRTIERVGRLWDVSVVSFPANPRTDVALRSRDRWREMRDAQRKDERPVCAAEGECGNVVDSEGDYCKNHQPPVETLTVRLDAPAPELLEKMAVLSECLEDRLDDPDRDGLWRQLLDESREAPEDRQSRPEFEGTEDIVPDWVDEGTWDRPNLSDHPEAGEDDTWDDLSEDEQSAIRGRFIEKEGDTYGDLSNPVVNPDTDNLNRNGVLAARQRPASDEAEAIADALWEEHFAEDEDEENAVDVGTLKRKLALEQAKVE